MAYVAREHTFAHKALHRVLAREPVATDQLESDIALRDRVIDAVDHAHSAAPYLLNDAIAVGEDFIGLEVEQRLAGIVVRLHLCERGVDGMETGQSGFDRLLDRLAAFRAETRRVDVTGAADRTPDHFAPLSSGSGP